MEMSRWRRARTAARPTGTKRRQPPSEDGQSDASTDAVVDAPADADGGLSATEALIVGLTDQACLICAQTAGCLGPGKTCEALAGQSAVAGPDAGESREQLCLDALSCGFNTICYEIGSGVVHCICGQALQGACMATGPVPDPGADCIPEEQAGLETTNATTEFVVQNDPALGAGGADTLLECHDNNLCTDCF